MGGLFAFCFAFILFSSFRVSDPARFKKSTLHFTISSATNE